MGAIVHIVGATGATRAIGAAGGPVVGNATEEEAAGLTFGESANSLQHHGTCPSPVSDAEQDVRAFLIYQKIAFSVNEVVLPAEDLRKGMQIAQALTSGGLACGFDIVVCVSFGDR